MSRVPYAAIDVLFVAALFTVCTIAATGGGDLHVATMVVHLRHVGNPLIVTYALAALRYGLRTGPPFLGIRTLKLNELDTQALTTIRGVWGRLRACSSVNAWRFIGIFAAIVLAIKLANAWAYFGFFSGDDVEIHEMTLGRLFHKDWPIWNLRSAFFPMVFIYPVQRALTAVGVTAPRLLVFAGRAGVAIMSTAAVPLLFSIARRSYGTRVALLAAVFVGWNALCIAFGSTELPRPVSTIFVLLAYAGTLRGSLGAAAWAGLTVGIAASMRFSEFVFIVPATIQLMLARRWMHTVVFLATCAGAAGAIQASSDYLFWGQAFFSLKNAVAFTLIHGESSRGFQAPWYYAANVTAWTDLLVAGCAVYGTTWKAWRPALWAWTPVLLLSTLPHKEPRYLLPAIPFVALLAALGLSRLVESVSAPDASISSATRRRGAMALMAAFIGSCLYQAGGFHFRRSEDAVRVAAALRAGHVAGAALEQSWRFGGHLYLQDALILDVGNDDLRDPARAAAIAQDPTVDTVVVQPADCDRACMTALLSAGYQEDSKLSALGTYKVFRKVAG